MFRSHQSSSRATTAIAVIAVLLFSSRVQAQNRADYFEIRVIDAQTGRGIPLVSLTTTNGVQYVTDNAGRVAYFEPSHSGEQVFFSIEPQGYEVPKDGLGIEGIRLTIKPGASAEVKLKRINIAERLYRITGEGLYRDSLLLGAETPLAHPLGSGKVVGQDSVQVAIYNDKLHWFWGDTSRISYPLGIFRTAGATSQLPENGGLSPEFGIDLNYFTSETGFVRNMVDLPEKEGVVWIDGVCVVDNQQGVQRLVAHYSRRKGLAEQLAHGIVDYDDQRNMFINASELEQHQDWQHLANHPVQVVENEKRWIHSGTPFPVTRVPATYESILNPEEYQSWTCLAEAADPDLARPLRDSNDKLGWKWCTAPPVTTRVEARWLKQGIIKPEEAYYSPEDANQPGRRIQIHTGSVYRNEYRQCWVMIASEVDWSKNAPSTLGEIWYSESPAPHGPFNKAVKILTHNKQSFYNACQHPFFNQENGRVIFFEGTYTNMFTPSPPTPRYNYNQIMYRLDLDHSRIREVFGEAKELN